MSPNNNWTILQDILQDIEATSIVETVNNKTKKPTLKKLKQLLLAEIKLRYQDNPETEKMLSEAVPSEISISKWRNKPTWEKAVWEKLHSDKLFSSTKRAEMIEAIFSRGLTRSDSAAKLYLTMSGDYSDKLDIAQDGTMDKFREIQAVIHGKKGN